MFLKVFLVFCIRMNSLSLSNLCDCYVIYVTVTKGICLQDFFMIDDK